MDITVIGRNCEVPDRFRAHVDEKADKLGVFVDQDAMFEVRSQPGAGTTIRLEVTR